MRKRFPVRVVAVALTMIGSLLGGIALAPATGSSASWTIVGDAVSANPTNGANHPDIASVGGVPYVTWDDLWEHWQIRVDSLSASDSWSAVGDALTTKVAGANADWPSIADVGGVPYIAWEQSYGGGWRVYVSRPDSGSTSGWSTIGSLPYYSGDPSIAAVGGLPTSHSGITTELARSFSSIG